MTEQFVRVEGSVPQSTKEWLELQALRTNTSQKILVGNAIAQYKATNDHTNLGSHVEIMGLTAKKMEKLVQNIGQMNNNMSNSYVKIKQMVQFASFYLRKSTLNRRKNDQIYEATYRMQIIEDIIEVLSYIKECNMPAFSESVDILCKSVKEPDISYITELSKDNRGPDTPHHNIRYIGNTLDNTTIYDEISELAGNCITVPAKYREDKIESVKEYISNTYEQNEITNLITMFMCEIEKLEAKK